MQKSLAIIQTDLARISWPAIIGGGSQWSLDLRVVLEAFACHRPDMGYVQGMSYVAAMLLLHIPDRYMVFQCLANLLVRGHLLHFIRETLISTVIYSRKYSAPASRLHRKLEDDGIHRYVFLSMAAVDILSASTFGKCFSYLG